MTIRLMFLLIVCISISKGKAQTIEDALRYSSESLNGTARFNALSGAFGALGADVSSVAINPAASAIFVKSTGSATISILNHKNNADYFGSTTETTPTKSDQTEM